MVALYTRRWWACQSFLFCLLGLAVFEAYTGYLLPMDQLALWATQTGMEMLLTLPLGDQLRALLVPDGIGQPLDLGGRDPLAADLEQIVDAAAVVVSAPINDMVAVAAGVAALVA